VRALRVELEKALDSSKTQIVGVGTASESGWTVMDAFDVMVHIFTAETRSGTSGHLEDGNEVWSGALEPGTAGVPKATPRKAKAVKKVPRKKKTGR